MPGTCLAPFLFKPDFRDAWSNKGVTLVALGRHEEALEAYNKAIDIKPGLHETWYSKGNALNALGRHDEAQKGGLGTVHYFFTFTDIMFYKTSKNCL